VTLAGHVILDQVYPVGEGAEKGCYPAVSVLGTPCEASAMGIELELHSRKGRSRDTLLRGSYEHGEALARALERVGPRDADRLSRVDPYGDTFFGEQDAGVAAQEAEALAGRSADEGEKAALLDLAALLAECAATPGSCVWFMGD
jgi:hypothetical protein